MPPKLPTWLPALILCVGGSLAIRTAHLGVFAAGAITPAGTVWASGDRDMSCGVELQSYDAHSDHVLDTFTGAVHSQPQAFVFPAGTCLAGDGATYRIDGRVPCAEPHIYEVV